MKPEVAQEWETYGLALGNGRFLDWSELDDPWQFAEKPPEWGLDWCMVGVEKRSTALAICREYVAQYERAVLPVPELYLVVYPHSMERLRSGTEVHRRGVPKFVRYHEVLGQ